MGMTEGIAASYAVNIGPPREGPFGESAMETLGRVQLWPMGRWKS